MKVAIKPEVKEFKPVDLTITFESKEEILILREVLGKNTPDNMAAITSYTGKDVMPIISSIYVELNCFCEQNDLLN